MPVVSSRRQGKAKPRWHTAQWPAIDRATCHVRSWAPVDRHGRHRCRGVRSVGCVVRRFAGQESRPPEGGLVGSAIRSAERMLRLDGVHVVRRQVLWLPHNTVRHSCLRWLHSWARRRSCALMATMTVLADISTGPRRRLRRPSVPAPLRLASIAGRRRTVPTRLPTFQGDVAGFRLKGQSRRRRQRRTSIDAGKAPRVRKFRPAAGGHRSVARHLRSCRASGGWPSSGNGANLSWSTECTSTSTPRAPRFQ